MRVLTSKNKVLELLAHGATVITPNNRLSGALLQDYYTACTMQTVDKPTCLPYSSILVKSYEQLILNKPDDNHPVLLNKAQCHYLWQKLIKSHFGVTFSEGLLKAVVQAWEHCQQWQINPDDPAFFYTPQTRQFQQWWLAITKQLKNRDAINEQQLVPYLLNAGCSLFSSTVIWVCFNEFTPQQLHLQNHLNNQGVTQYCYELKENTVIPTVLAAKDTCEEYQQLMAWLELKIQQEEQRIGVVVPNLEQESRSLQRLLLQHFDPALFNISLGQPLSDFPMIAHALVWLNLDTKQISNHQAMLLLQSPYVDNAKEELIRRSEYLQNSTLLQRQDFPFTRFVRDLETQTPKLAKLLNKLTPYPEKASINDWIELFQNRLNSLGFPGDYGLNSENYQCFNRFTTSFDEYRQFNLLCDGLTVYEALDTLKQLLKNTVFQAQKTNAKIQISGLLEASGCEFDSLWIMGLTDQCLPQKARLSAFIPPQLQRELSMPHSLPSRELHFAKQILQCLKNGSGNSVFSYSRLQEDNPNLPCSLIKEFPEFHLLPVIEQKLPSSLTSLDEDFIIPFKSTERISGGTRLLANQAKCPFKAYAEHRLRGESTSRPTDGLDHTEKGILIHKVMELLWQTLGSQKKLLTMDSETLNEHIDNSINQSLSLLDQTQLKEIPELTREVEFTRLKRLIVSCLELEKQRPSFEIAALEQNYSINLAGMEIQVRLDRLDQVGDKKWVIDYKSSFPATKPWNEDRPMEPQLLIYALLDDQINTLLLMQLKTGKIMFNGLSEDQLEIRGITSLKGGETWESRKKYWEQQLTRLAEEFQQGYCLPKPGSMTICQQCDYQNLCRYPAN